MGRVEVGVGGIGWGRMGWVGKGGGREGGNHGTKAAIHFTPFIDQLVTIVRFIPGQRFHTGR